MSISNIKLKDELKKVFLNRECLRFAKDGDLKSLTEVVSQGADVSSQNKDSHGNIALVLAAENGHVDCVEFLSKLTDLESKSVALFKAVESGRENIIRILMSGDKETVAKIASTALLNHERFRPMLASPIERAITKPEILKLLLDLGATLESTVVIDGISLLHIAVQRYPEAVPILLQHKQDWINATTIHGVTPLHAAVLANRPDSVELLLAHGADWEIKADDDHPDEFMQSVTALQLATVMMLPKFN